MVNHTEFSFISFAFAERSGPIKRAVAIARVSFRLTFKMASLTHLFAIATSAGSAIV